MEIKTLHEVCNIFGVSRRAVQGYEEAGLVSASDRNKYGYLLYDENAQNRIKRIKLYQDFGFKIKEIKEIIDAPNPIVKAALQNKIIIMQKEQKRRDELIEKAYRLIESL